MRRWHSDAGSDERGFSMIDKLEYLLALAREKHFGRAALACGVTQPTLSSGIRQLEETLGALLVVRGSRFHGLTAEGDRTLVWARRIVADARAMRAELGGVPAGLTGRLRLAAVPSAMAAVASLTTPYRALHPAVTFSVLSRTSEEISALLEGLEIDAGLTYLHGEEGGRVREVALFRERYCLIIAEAESTGLDAVVSWDEVGQVPLCLLTPDMQNRRIIDSRLLAAGRGVGAVLETNSVITLMTHARTGHWASVVSESIAAAFGLPEGIRSIPILDAEPGPSLGIAYTARDPVTPLTGALLEIARGLANGSGLAGNGV